MTQTTVPQAGATRALSLPERLIGAIFSPKPTFESVSAHPVWVDVLAITIVLTSLAWFAFLSTDTGRQAFIDQQFQQQEAWGQTITPEVEQRINGSAPVMRWVIPISTLVIGPLFVVVIAGVLYGVFAALLGGGATFKQTLAVVVHAGVVTTVAGLGIMVLNFVARLDEQRDESRCLCPDAAGGQFSRPLPRHDRPDVGLVPHRPRDRSRRALPAQDQHDRDRIFCGVPGGSVGYRGFS